MPPIAKVWTCMALAAVLALGCQDPSDDDDDDTSAGDDDSFDECTGVSQTAGNTLGPVDVVFAIDNSPSLEDEIAEVRAHMNDFSQMVGDSGVDHNIVILSCLPGDCGNENFFGVCIDPPLAIAGACDSYPASDDSNPPHYLHISERIPSTKGLDRIIETYPEWQSMMRPGAPKHFVAISDDNEDHTAEWFDTELLALDAGFAGYTFHGIFSYLSKEDACDISNTEPCCTYAAPEGEGTVYKDLVAQTGGVSGDLCEQEFQPVFDALGTAVVGSATLSCEWVIPEPPEGMDLDPALVNFVFTDDDGVSTVIGRVDSEADCANVEHGWYYDDPDNPTMVYVCPQTCAWIQGFETATVVIEFGCESAIAPQV